MLALLALTGCSSESGMETVETPVPIEQTEQEPEQKEETQEPQTPVVDKPSNVISQSREQKEAISSNTDFAFNLYRQISQMDGIKGKSNIISPISLTYVLGLLNAGATDLS